MMHRDRAWRRRKAHFEQVREVEAREAQSFRLKEVAPKSPAKPAPAHDMRLNLQLAEDLRDGVSADAIF